MEPCATAQQAHPAGKRRSSINLGDGCVSETTTDWAQEPLAGIGLAINYAATQDVIEPPFPHL